MGGTQEESCLWRTACFAPPPFAVEAFVWPLVCATRAMAMD